MTAPPAGTEACGCCEGVTARVPVPVFNRPGHAEISYRVGLHSDFLADMVAALSDVGRPALSQLKTRDTEDPTIALLDAWAVAGDVLTFYTERLANESYLRTATERTSLQELGKLVAYRLHPGVAAETNLAFSLERPPALPADLPPDPGMLPPTVPAGLLLGPGLRVQSVPGPGELPQTFETVEPLEARPEWNALPVARTTPYPPVFGRRAAWFAGTALGLRRGDAVLFASQDLVNDRWDVRIVTEVVPDPPGDRTHVWWDRGLGSFTPPNNPADDPDCFVLRKRFSVFGHNAPVWAAMNTEFKNGYKLVHPQPSGSPDTEWPGFTAVVASGANQVVDLDGSHPDVVEGSWVVVSQEAGAFSRELYEVVAKAESSRSEFAVSGTVTRLTLRGEAFAFRTPRDVTVLAVADPLALVEAPDTSAVSTAEIVVDGDASAMAAGRRVILSGPGSAEVVTLASVTAVAGGRTALTLTAAPTDAYTRSTAVVFGNVARATHGETVTEVLGSGDGRRSFQRFPLSFHPLTYVPSDDPRGAASTLTVRVDEVAWEEVPTLYGAGPADHVFVTRVEPEGPTVAEFGDGRGGARLPSGSQNVRATYRKGLGDEGNVPALSLSQALDRPLGLKSVTNPRPATGGVDPENEAQARASIPLPVRALGRAVSLRDYSDFALAFAGITIAEAAVLNLRGGRSIVVTVAGLAGAPAPASTVERLASALRRSGDPHVRVYVMPHRPATFRVALKVRVDPAYLLDETLAAVETALRAAYAPAARRFGQPVHRSALIAVAASVPGVVGVDLDRLYRGAPPGLAVTLLAEPASAGPAGVAVAGELLSLSSEPFDWLEPLP